MSVRVKKEVLDVLEVYRPRSKKLIEEIERGCGYMSDSFKKELARYLEKETLDEFISYFDKTPTKYEKYQYNTLESLHKRYDGESIETIVSEVLKKAEKKKIAFDTGRRYLNALLLEKDALSDSDKKLIGLAKNRIFIAMDMDKIFKNGTLYESKTTYAEILSRYEEWQSETSGYKSRNEMRKKLIASLYIKTPTLILDYFPFRFNSEDETVTISEYGKPDVRQKLTQEELDIIGRIKSSEILSESKGLLFETLSEVTNIKQITPAFIFLTKLRDEGKLEVPVPKPRPSVPKKENLTEKTTDKKKTRNTLTNDQKSALDAHEKILTQRIDGGNDETYIDLFQRLEYKDTTLADWFGGASKGNRYFKTIAKNRKKHWDLYIQS